MVAVVAALKRARNVLALVVGLVVLEVVSYFSLKRYAQGLGGIPTVAWEEFPEIDPGLLDKFTSFDPDLGWVPQPNTTKQKDTGDHLPGEEVENVVEYSTDEYGSRVCPAKDRDDGNAADVTVSTYGDSYCFCRGVDDDETFQHYLAQKLDTHVGNYGAGNYGLDQALLRLKHRYPDDPTDYVIMNVTAASIARILSVWKHYQEFGNVLAVKPRYILDDGSLELIESPIDEKEDLLDLESRADFLRTHDFHYDRWFRPHLASFPYTTTFLQRPDHVRYSLDTAMKGVESQFGVSVPGVDFDARQSGAATRLEQPRVKYHEELFDEKEELFSELLGEFVSYAQQEGFTPVFVMVRQLRYAKYEAEHGPIYGDLLDRIDERYPDLVTIDMGDHLAETGDVESLYVRRGEGGHYSPETNETIADVLADELSE